MLPSLRSATRNASWPTSPATNRTVAEAEGRIPAEAGERRAHGADCHLRGAIQSRGRSDEAGLDTDGLRQGGRARDARTHRVDEKGADGRGHRQMARKGEGEIGGAAGDADEIAADHQPFDRYGSHEHAHGGGAEGDAGDQEAEIDADHLRRLAELVRENEGRCGNEGVGSGRRAAAADRVADERGRTEQAAIVLRKDTGAEDARRPRRLAQDAQDEDDVDEPEQAEPDEDGAPADAFRRDAADERREAGPDGLHQVHQRELAHGLDRKRRVAHDGAAEHEARAAAEALQQASGDEGAHIGGEGRGDPGSREHAKSGDQHGASAVAIRQGAVDELARGEPHDVEADGELDGGFAGAEILRDGGEGGDEDVHRGRAREHDHDEQPEGWGGRLRLRKGHPPCWPSTGRCSKARIRRRPCGGCRSRRPQ